MYKNNKLSKAVRLAIAFGASSAIFAAGAVSASEATTEVDADKVERVQVTGSRIMRAELAQPSPTIVIGQEEIARFGSPDLGSILAELPAVGAGSTLFGNADSNANAGLSSANLRNLGATRTLVLVNGRRHVAGAPGSAQVDLTTIPASLVERVEILTGGASAIYGSDAVSGVINVILKQDFEGLELSGTAAGSTQGVGDKTHTLNLLAGADVANGRGNVTFFAGLERNQEIMYNDIRQLERWGTVDNPDDTGRLDGIPDRIFVKNIYSEMISPNGVLNPFAPGAAGRWVFTDDGTAIPQQERDLSNSFAFGSFPDGCQYCFNTQDYINFRPGVQRHYVGSTLSFDLADNHRFFSDFKYISSEITQQFQPSFLFGNISINVNDNAFLPADIRQTLLDAGQTIVPMAKFFDELGNRSADNRRSLFRFVSGIEGSFELGASFLDYELFYVYGETNNTRRTLNDLIPGNFTAAVDSVINPATGQAACRTNVASAQPDGYQTPATVNPSQCTPYNPFGFGLASQQAMDYVSADVTREDKITQEVVGVQFVTDSSALFELQGGAIGLAFGAEYREETSQTITDEFTKAGFLLGAATPDVFGKYHVKEGFAEVSIPVLADLTFVDELTIDAAYRYADYSHSGSADTWSLGFVYAPIEDVRLRASIAQAVRASNITEAFTPQSPGFANVSDPCDATRLNRNENRPANCAALGLPADFSANDNVSINTVSGGNPNLKPENSRSKTAGIVWTPTFVNDLSISLDYYSFEITDAILFIAAQTVVDNCVDSAGGPSADFCPQIDRDPSTGDITTVRSGYLNASSRNTSGYELEARYNFDVNSLGLDGRMQSRLLVSRLIRWEDFEFQDQPELNNLNTRQVGFPKWQGRFSLTYREGDYNVNWSARYVNRSALYNVTPRLEAQENVGPAWIGSMLTHDLSFGYSFGDNLQISAGVRNVFDKVPPGYTQNVMYDLIGRRAFGGFTYTF